MRSIRCRWGDGRGVLSVRCSVIGLRCPNRPPLSSPVIVHRNGDGTPMVSLHFELRSTATADCQLLLPTANCYCRLPLPVVVGEGVWWNRGAAGSSARFPEGAGGVVAAARRGQESSADRRALPATPSGNLPSGRLRRNLPHPVVYPSRGTYSLVVQVICRSISTPGERKAAAVPPGNSHSMIIASGRTFHFRLPTATADC
jgi:hypothetical protein